MSNNFIEAPETLTISNDRLLIRKNFREVMLTRQKKTEKQVRNEVNLLKKDPSGIVTRKVKKRMTTVLTNWLQALDMSPERKNGYREYMPTFVTLTLPAKQMHSDKDLFKLALNRFIIKIQRSHKVKHYFWRAEKQDNGNLHYHVICDRFIGWKCLRGYWNTILNDLGYIEQYRHNQEWFHRFGFQLREDLVDKWSAEAQFYAYQDGIANNWSDPNSTDIHALHKVKNVVAYITKYVTKSEAYFELQQREKQFIKGEIDEAQFNFYKQILEGEIEFKKVNARLWGRSDALEQLKDCEMIMSWGGNTCGDAIGFVEAVSNDKESRVIVDEYYTIIYSKKIREYMRKFGEVQRYNNTHRRNNYYHLYGKLKVKPPGLFDVSKNNADSVIKTIDELTSKQKEILSKKQLSFLYA